MKRDVRLRNLHEGRFDRLLQHVFGSQAIHDILHCELDQRHSFQRGGCWIGADALCRYLRQAGVPAELWAVHGVHQDENEFGFYGDGDEMSPVAQHVVVRVGDTYYDSDGAHSGPNMLRKVQRYEGVVDPTLQPWLPEHAGEIYHSEGLVQRLYEHLLQTLGDPREWRGEFEGN